MGDVIELRDEKFKKALGVCERNLKTKGYMDEADREFFINVFSEFVRFPVTIEHLKEALRLLNKEGSISGKETPIGMSLASWNSLSNMMINPLIEIVSGLEGRKELTSREVRSLRKTLKNITYNGYILLGVAPIELKECYEMTKRDINRKKNQAR